jgi:hypothetical protein
MSLEAWKSIFEDGGVILLGLTFVFGAGALIAANRMNRAQAAKLRDFQLRIEGEQQKTAEAQKEAAKAQLELRSFIDKIEKKSRPRRFDPEKFRENLKGNPTGHIAIWYKAEDIEAFAFARQIHSLLNSAAWQVSPPVPIPTGAEDPDVPNAPAEFVHGGAVPGLTLRYGQKNVAQQALMDALLRSRDVDIAVAMGGVQDPALPENTFLIVVGQKD